jgi:hypothetical protein
MLLQLRKQFPEFKNIVLRKNCYVDASKRMRMFACDHEVHSFNPFEDAFNSYECNGSILDKFVQFALVFFKTVKPDEFHIASSLSMDKSFEASIDALVAAMPYGVAVPLNGQAMYVPWTSYMGN